MDEVIINCVMHVLDDIINKYDTMSHSAYKIYQNLEKKNNITNNDITNNDITNNRINYISDISYLNFGKPLYQLVLDYIKSDYFKKQIFIASDNHKINYSRIIDDIIIRYEHMISDQWEFA